MLCYQYFSGNVSISVNMIIQAFYCRICGFSDNLKERVMRKTIKFLLLISVLCVLGLCGCSSKEERQCQEQVKAFLTAYQEQDTTCGKYLSGNEDNESVEFKGFQAILAEPVKFQIKSAEVNKDYNIVKVIVTNVDFGKVFEELVNDDLQVETREAIVTELEKRLQAEDAPMREFEISVKLDKNQKIEMTSELSNALLGGYTQYIYELTEGGAQ